MVGLLGNLGDCLNAGRAGADKADFLGLEVDAFLRVAAGMDQPALEALQPRYVWEIRRREATGRGDAELRLEGIAALRPDNPQLTLVVIGARRNSRLELDVLAQVES